MRAEYRIRDMVFYDDDGNEIPDEELPWSSYAKGLIPATIRRTGCIRMMVTAPETL